MPENSVAHSIIWKEKLALSAVVVIYLAIFSTESPTGDALVYVNHVLEGNVYWNPNHLLMDPVGYYWHGLITALGSNEGPLFSFKLLSGLSAVISLVIFHSVLLTLGVRSTSVRIFGVLGLFFSKNFLSMGITEEFFIIQMPFLIAGLWFLVKWWMTPDKQQNFFNDLFLSGVMLAVASAVIINNVVVLFFVGLAVAFIRPTPGKMNLGNPIVLWTGAASVCLPLFMLGFLLSGSDDGLLAWVTSYQGSTENPSQQLYGLEWDAAGVLAAFARLSFNTVANFLDTAGLGTALKSLVFSYPLEYKINWLQLALNTLMVSMLVIGLAFVTVWILRTIRHANFLKILIIWILAYMLFNFFWNDSADQFWIQILPVCWLLILMYLGSTTAELVSGHKDDPNVQKNKIQLFRVFVGCLILLNTWQYSFPGAFANLDQKTARYMEIVKEGDIEIVTGWDDIRWFSLRDESKNIDRIVLMNAALGRDARFQNTRDMTEYVQANLMLGKRVIVARLYDLDSTARPWDQLSKLGWSRQALQQSFEVFGNRVIGEVDGVVFRELYLLAD